MIDKRKLLLSILVLASISNAFSAGVLTLIFDNSTASSFAFNSYADLVYSAYDDDDAEFDGENALNFYSADLGENFNFTSQDELSVKMDAELHSVTVYIRGAADTSVNESFTYTLTGIIVETSNIQGIVNFTLGATSKAAELVYTIIGALVDNWGATLAVAISIGAVLLSIKKNVPKLSMPKFN